LPSIAADRTLDRSYDYDHVGRLSVSTTGSNARHHVGWGGTPTHDGPYSQLYVYDLWGNLTQRVGWGGENPSYAATFSGNRMQYNTANGWTMQHDAAGNQTFDGGQHYSYDATGQQAFASLYTTEQGYDGDRLRVRRSENWAATYYVRSSVLGGQVVAEVTSGGGWQRGYVYLGSQLLALQAGGVEWAHQDPVTKSQRLTNVNGAVTVIVEMDPWGGESWGWSSNSWWQPRRYTTYTRDGNGSDEAMMRRYNRLWAKFEQPDPYDGSYDLSDPQSFNRYAYVQNDPVNFVDSTGLDDEIIDPGEVITINTSTSRWPTISISLGTGFPPYDLLPDPEVVGDGESLPNTTPAQELPCPEMPMRPSKADLNGNIRLAMTKNASERASTSWAATVAKYGWFYNKVKPGGDWDYKKLSRYGTRLPNGVEKREFEDFGNFHYGATGAAAGFTEGQLLRLGGRVHTDPRTAQGERAGRIDALLGRGGKEPFGDDPEDQRLIKLGIEYFRRGCYK
jgi:RHS repeat-associated protein